MSIKVTGLRGYVYVITLLALLSSILSLTFRGLNLGVDFRGGMLVEIRSREEIDIVIIRSKLSNLFLGEFKLQGFDDNRGIMLRFRQPQGWVGLNYSSLVNKIKTILGKDLSYQRIEYIGPKITKKLVKSSLEAFLASILGIFLYIWFRFKLSFSICGMISLLNDTLLLIGFYSLSANEFNETSILVILTIIGYSVNSSVIIYDRIRDNIKILSNISMWEIIDLSVNETLSRTIMTTATTLLSLLVLYFFGGPVISSFSLPIIIGIILGSFSSTFISTNLLMFFSQDRRKGLLR